MNVAQVFQHVHECTPQHSQGKEGMANIQKDGIPTFSNMFSQASSCKRILTQRCTWGE